MKNEKYYVGLDIGTDSVGYAVTSENYSLCKFKGEPMWGVTLFDEAQLAVERRAFRVARRRLDRRQQRVSLLQELFAKEIAKVDDGFYKRIKESYLYPTNDDQKVRLFGIWAEQKAYVNKYPTIHHLINELMTGKEEHDARLVYIACAWLVAHRGHFLSEVDKHNVDKVTDFGEAYRKLVEFIKHDEYALPWHRNNRHKRAVEEVNRLKALDKLSTAGDARTDQEQHQSQLAEHLQGGRGRHQLDLADACKMSEDKRNQQTTARRGQRERANLDRSEQNAKDRRDRKGRDAEGIDLKKRLSALDLNGILAVVSATA